MDEGVRPRAHAAVGEKWRGQVWCGGGAWRCAAARPTPHTPQPQPTSLVFFVGDSLALVSFSVPDTVFLEPRHFGATVLPVSGIRNRERSKKLDGSASLQLDVR